MDTLLMNEVPLEVQLQRLIAKLVKQQVQEQLKELKISFQQTLPEIRQMNEPVKEFPVQFNTVTENAMDNNREPEKFYEEKIKGLIRTMAPDRKRQSTPLLIQARMLIKLYESREEGIAPGSLFLCAKTSNVAGYRYISFFKEHGYVAFIGPRRDGKYILTSKGVELMEGNFKA